MKGSQDGKDGGPRVPKRSRGREEAVETRRLPARVREGAERALRESEERLRVIVESIQDYAIFSIDTEGRVTSWNEGARRLKGYTTEEIIGQPLDRFYTPQDIAADKPGREMEIALTTGRSEDESWRVRKDGSRFWVNEIMTPLRAADGTLLGFTKISRDLTERRRAEELTRAIAERLRLVVESVGDYAIFTIDTAGMIDSWNAGAERIFGYSEKEAIGRHTEIIFTPEDRERGAPEEEMRQASELGRAEDERWHLSKNGARFYVSGVLAPLTSEGRISGYVKVARDLTERKQFEDALRRAHDELEERVRERTLELATANDQLRREVGVRRAAEGRVKDLLKQLVTAQEEERRRLARELHDTLGQQLAALRLGIALFRSKADDPVKLRGQVERMQTIFDRLNAEIDFLAKELRPAVLDELGLAAALQSYVGEWSEHFGIEADYQGIGLEGGPRLPPEVETHLYRILQEALQNVHKHAGAGRVSVLLERRDGEAVLVVEDDGSGYDMDDEAANFGRGRGLLNMRERAALIGGSFKVESVAGEGTSVYVRVPLGRPT